MMDIIRYYLAGGWIAILGSGVVILIILYDFYTTKKEYGHIYGSKITAKNIMIVTISGIFLAIASGIFLGNIMGLDSAIAAASF